MVWFAVAEALAAVPLEAAPGELVAIDLVAECVAELEALAANLEIEPAEAARRILVALGREGPMAALRAINTRRIGRRRKGRTRR